MKHVLIKTNTDRGGLATTLFPVFKEHLRVLHDHEDDMIMMYLLAAIDAISIYGDNDINLTEYEVFYPMHGGYDYTTPSNMQGWWCGKKAITNMAILEPVTHVDMVSKFKVDYESGMVYPHPKGYEISFNAGYVDADMMPPRLVNIIFRLGASYHEMREHEKIGETKLLPSWVNFAMASIWTPKV